MSYEEWHNKVVELMCKAFEMTPEQFEGCEWKDFYDDGCTPKEIVEQEISCWCRILLKGTE